MNAPSRFVEDTGKEIPRRYAEDDLQFEYCSQFWYTGEVLVPGKLCAASCAKEERNVMLTHASAFPMGPNVIGKVLGHDDEKIMCAARASVLLMIEKNAG
jgi:hypothetical protein